MVINQWQKKRQSKIAEKEESGGIFSFCNQAYICSCGLSGYLFIGLLYVFNYFYPTSGKKPVAVEQKKQPADPVKEKPADKKPAIVPPRPKTTTFKVPANAEIPKLKAKRSEQVIRHEGYTVSYNSDYKIANWVAYELTAEEAKSKKTERSNKIRTGPDGKKVRQQRMKTIPVQVTTVVIWLLLVT